MEPLDPCTCEAKLHECTLRITTLEDALSKMQSMIVKLQKGQRGISIMEPIYFQQMRDEKKTEPPSMVKKLAEDVSSVVGLTEIAGTSRPSMKIVWAILFFLGTVATIYFIYATTAEYFEEPTVTKIKIMPEAFYEYPPIVLAYNAWFDQEKAKALGLSNDSLTYALGYWDSYENDLQLNNVSSAKNEFLDLFSRSNFSSLIDLFEAISIDLEPMSSYLELEQSARPAYYAYELEKPMQKIYLPYSGICHAFYPASVDGRLGILQRMVSITVKYVNVTYPIETQLGLYLGDDASSLYLWPFSLKPSTRYFLVVRSKKYTFFNSPSYTCTSSHYSSAACMNDCMSLLIKNLTNCYDLESTTGKLQLPPGEFCNFLDPRDGESSDFLTKAIGTLKKKVGETCISRCPYECNRVLHEIVVQGEDEEPQSNHTNLSTISLRILHEAVADGGIVHVEEESSYSFVQLVNNIGGTLGLFIGATIMTFPQVIYFLWDCAYEIARRRRKSKTMSK